MNHGCPLLNLERGRLEIGRNHQEDETRSKAASEYPPGLRATHRQFQPKPGAIPAPFMSFRPPTAEGVNTHGPPPMPHHQSQLRLRGESRPFHQPPTFSPPGSNPSAADDVPSKTQQRFTANTAAVYRSAVGVYAPRSIWNPKSTQMTMFYNGAVNVFNDVPADKAQEIMVLASRASTSNPPGVVQKSDSPVFANKRFAVLEARKITIQKPETFSPHVSVISSPNPVVSQAPTLSKSTSGYQNYTPAPTSSGVPSVVPPVSRRASSAEPMQQASTAVAAAITPIAVRQSRKASLARFLERRKERVSSVTPYPLSKSPLQSSGTLGSASTPSKLSGADNAPPSNNCQESMSMDTYNGTMLAMPRRVIIELE